MQYSKEAIKVFFENQTKLFDFEVVDDISEVQDFLEDCMAVELKNFAQVKAFMKENDLDISGMTDEEILEQSEIFPLSGGKFLVVPA